ncbi:MAG: hypothetical protein HLUCCA11_13865 [Phormidesmis priestleyi Ana]|uniref:Uncharacterized protein n=1 Tax=Phormidesmis priestleyi Ana TaxID=1666911 RepID=A0A0P7ZW69_9CYAN|nr:MAG: hypothetical protein HLUCCA11_13865 [Phormidesmis priestleyi Ana]
MAKWLSTTPAAAELGVTPKFLRENRLKLFEAGRHYRLKNPTAYRPSYVWQIEACVNLLNQATREAAAIEKGQLRAAAGRGSQLPLVPGVEPYEIS